MVESIMENYWGRAGAGILFICNEDRTILLSLRSMDVNEPGTWGIPGGAIKVEGTSVEDNFVGAKREVVEEFGSLPSNMKVIGRSLFKDKDFKYTTFFVEIPLKEKKSWTPKITLDWENDDVEWFAEDNLPGNLHFGVKFALTSFYFNL